MLTELLQHLSGWGAIDTWIALTAALAAMACCVPGVFLVVRRQSLMGDALSHAMLPGIVIAYLVFSSVRATGWVSAAGYDAWRHLALALGALVLGLVCALLTEAVQKLGRLESGAAMGVVFTSLFALGLLLTRLYADQVDLDPDCVLYGLVETSVFDMVYGVPIAAWVNGVALLVNLLVLVIFFKELRIAAFDPALATSLGIPASIMHYGLMAITAATLVVAFESVGSILVIAMMIAPPAAAQLLSDRLSRMFLLSLGMAAAAAVLGHAMAISLPPVIFSRLGYPDVRAVSTAGMTAVAAGLLFFAALLLGPRYGVISKLLDQLRLGLRIAGDDILGLLYRIEERHLEQVNRNVAHLVSHGLGITWLMARLAMLRLRYNGLLTSDATGYHLTDDGRTQAAQLVRSHRLWEAYLAKHFDIADDHLHESAERVEHFLDANLRQEIADDLHDPAEDPHGREIPEERE